MPFHNQHSNRFGKIARVDLADFTTSGVSVLDLTLTNPYLKGYQGGFTGAPPSLPLLPGARTPGPNRSACVRRWKVWLCGPSHVRPHRVLWAADSLQRDAAHGHQRLVLVAVKRAATCSFGPGAECSCNVCECCGRMGGPVERSGGCWCVCGCGAVRCVCTRVACWRRARGPQPSKPRRD